MSSIIQALSDRVVGAVEEVSADRIIVLLDNDAPQATALNTGFPEGFPRINGYLLIPNEVGATIGWISSVKIERLPYPKRMGMQDFGLVDLPFPCRMVMLTPLGTLVQNLDAKEGERELKVNRGVDVFPSVGDPVLLPTPDQLQVIVEGESGDTRRIILGHCPTAAGAAVYVDPDKLFGRHLAVLGNTGAGKSCSVAGIIRWSIDAAKRKLPDKSVTYTNARFIILDPNGEYASAFTDLGNNIRLFQAEPVQDARAKPLKVPAWLWNGEEWAAFTGAAPGVQRPILFDALRRLRTGYGPGDSFTVRVRGRCNRYLARVRGAVEDSEHLMRGKREGFADILINIQKDLLELNEDTCSCSDESLRQGIQQIAQDAAGMESSARTGAREGGRYWHNSFSESDIESRIVKPLEELLNEIALPDDGAVASEDTPCYFPLDELLYCVRDIASDSSVRDVSHFIDSLNLRIRSLITRGSLAPILNPNDSSSIRLEEWLDEYVGTDNAVNGEIVVIDLSLVPSEVIHIVIAVLARLTFEALQRYRRETKKELPTVLVLEEAHTFVHRQLAGEEATPAARTCCRVFERIAREGRKFGLGLVLASQRPSELSQTVLSQCNTFLLHRIVNDRDQELVKKLVPDGLGSLLRELPSLPSRRAIILGWASPAPVMVEIKALPESQRPHSPDPAFWDVWTRNGEKGQRPIDWGIISRNWAGTAEGNPESGSAEEEMGPSDDDFGDGEPQEEDLPFDRDWREEEPDFDDDDDLPF